MSAYHRIEYFPYSRLSFQVRAQRRHYYSTCLLPTLFAVGFALVVVSLADALEFLHCTTAEIIKRQPDTAQRKA